jgi:small conductance mechanosensitive channel
MTMTEITDLVTLYGVRVAGAVAVLVAGWLGAKWVRRITRRALDRSGLDRALVPFLSSLVYYGLLVFVGLAVLNLFGIQTASFIAVLGAAGFAVGLSLQGTLSNFASGVMLLVFRPFSVGDVVDTGGAKGTVKEIGILTTKLDTPDNVRILVPNSKVFGNLIENYTAHDTRRLDLEVGISYDDDVGTALEACERMLADEGRVLEEPAPLVAVAGLGDSSVNLMVRPWCRTDDYWPLKRDLTRRLKEELEAAGCELPYPQRDVHLHGEGGADGAPEAT